MASMLSEIQRAVGVIRDESKPPESGDRADAQEAPTSTEDPIRRDWSSEAIFRWDSLHVSIV